MDEAIFTALDGKLRLIRHSEDGGRTHRTRTTYSVWIHDDDMPCGSLGGLTRHHLTALHHALTNELVRTQAYMPRYGR